MWGGREGQEVTGHCSCFGWELHTRGKNKHGSRRGSLRRDQLWREAAEITETEDEEGEIVVTWMNEVQILAYQELSNLTLFYFL